MTDVATWLAMVLNEGKSADGTQLIDPQALNAALTPHIRSVDGSPTPKTIVDRAGFYGYGFNVNSDATGRVRIGHSGAFGLGAGTTFLGIPDLDLGIVVLTNAAPIGAAEALSQEFADIANPGASSTTGARSMRPRSPLAAPRPAPWPTSNHRRTLLRRHPTRRTSAPTRTTTSDRRRSARPEPVWS